jgi:hypothetical protein
MGSGSVVVVRIGLLRKLVATIAAYTSENLWKIVIGI